MVCKIKFNDPLLDNYMGVETRKEYRELAPKRINALFKYYLKGNEGDIPNELSPAVMYVITNLAELAEVPGFISADSVSKAGQPSRWNGEDGFILSARVQLHLLTHPEHSERKAVISVARKYFKDVVEDGVYHRYSEGLKNKGSYIFKTKHAVNRIKELNDYDGASEERKKEIIEGIKRHLNILYKGQFQNGNPPFKENPSKNIAFSQKS
jgi:hypothetical protein